MRGLVDPTGGVQLVVRQRAPRQGRTLRGARVGLVDNGKQNAEAFLRALGALLQSQYGAAEVVLRRKPHFTLPAPSELLEELASCDFVVAGVGD